MPHAPSSILTRLVLAAGAAALAAGTPAIRAQAEPPDPAGHVAAARAAAGTDWEFLYDRLCAAPPAPPAAAAPSTTPPAATPRAAGPPDRAAWYAPPVKVFDNLSYVGMSEYSAWAVTTSDGIILVDAIFDYSVEAEVAGGLRTLGLDPKTIKYVIVSHGHNDHAGGAKYLQDTFGARIVLSAADWELLERGTGPKPRRDVIATEGMPLTLGDTTITLHVTPGHTLGTISTVIPLKDRGQPHVAVTWGGTAFNWLANRNGYITPERPDAFWFRHYAESAARFREIAARAGADVVLSNHTNFDGSKRKLPLMATRGAGQPNPYVVGAAAVRNYLTVANECAQAGLARVAPG
jgi:metallo-beta-lactamase class B